MKGRRGPGGILVGRGEGGSFSWTKYVFYGGEMIPSVPGQQEFSPISLPNFFFSEIQEIFLLASSEEFQILEKSIRGFFKVK